MKYFLAIILLSTLACSTTKKDRKEIEQEKQTTQVNNAQALGQTIHDLIANSTTLNDQQKAQLKEILAANKAKAEELQGESYKYRAVLIKELLTGKSTKSRIRILENDIKKVEKMRLKNTFDTVKKISAIVEKHPALHDELVNHMMNVEGRGSMTR